MAGGSPNPPPPPCGAKGVVPPNEGCPNEGVALPPNDAVGVDCGGAVPNKAPPGAGGRAPNMGAWVGRGAPNKDTAAAWDGGV